MVNKNDVTEMPFEMAVKTFRIHLIHRLAKRVGMKKAEELVDSFTARMTSVEVKDSGFEKELFSLFEECEGLNPMTKLTRDEVIRETQMFIQRNGLTHTPIVLGYGAALVMHGLRESTSDLDFDVTLNVMAFLRMKHKAPIISGLVGMCSQISPIISIHPALWGDQEIVMVDGVLCYTLETLRKHKAFLRDHPLRMPHKQSQDILDIAAIDAVLNP